eukprot:m.198501 g.198501  ORF g.198501 m.198501 type:complete len:392 (+) comp20463_c0_seq1:131-1306(+)
MDGAAVTAIGDADCIGFDVDHTLVRYHNERLSELIHRAMITFLCETRGYPDALLRRKYDATKTQRGMVWDHKTGDLVVLSACGLVTQGWHGDKALTASEIDEYNTAHDGGSSRASELLAALDDFNHRAVDASWFPTHFESPALQVVAGMITVTGEDTRNNGTVIKRLRADLDGAFEAAFNWRHFEADAGLYMQSLRRSPTEFIADRVADGTRQWLERLKLDKKRLFVLTNSNDDYADLVMRTAFGADWCDLFDVVLCRANKRRGFFAAGPDRPPFLRHDGPPLAALTPESGKLFLSGHYQGFQELVATWGCSRVVYFGDHLESDIHLAQKVANWRTVAVAEELSHPPLSDQLRTTICGRKTHFWGQHERIPDTTVADVKHDSLSHSDRSKV